MSKLAAALLLILALYPAAWAAKAEQAGPDAPAKMKWRYSYANLGYFGGRAEQSDFEGNNTGIAAGGGFGRRLNRYLAWEFDTLWAARMYETPSNIANAASQLLLNNLTFTLNVRVIVPFWKLEPWIGYGFGANVASVDIQSEFFAQAAAYSGKDVDFSTQWRFGLDFMYTRRGRLGIEVRDIIANASFGGVTSGDADVGGQMILFVVKIGRGKKS
jgi:opacity protein-like surface antigen